ncbi:MAG: hypothetical protein WBX19_22810 [Terracidiphilus sp.]
MGSHGYRETYLAALEVAHSDLDRIFQEYEQLKLRKAQIEGALGALEPFLGSSQPSTYEFRQPEPIQAEPLQVQREPEFVQPIFHAVPMPEPVIPAAFSPMPEAILDPIQSRINRALGLAVA